MACFFQLHVFCNPFKNHCSLGCSSHFFAAMSFPHLQHVQLCFCSHWGIFFRSGQLCLYSSTWEFYFHPSHSTSYQICTDRSVKISHLMKNGECFQVSHLKIFPPWETCLQTNLAFSAQSALQMLCVNLISCNVSAWVPELSFLVIMLFPAFFIWHSLKSLFSEELSSFNFPLTSNAVAAD